MQRIGSLDFQSSHFRVIKSDPAKKVNRLEGPLAVVISDVNKVNMLRQTTSLRLASSIDAATSKFFVFLLDKGAVIAVGAIVMSMYGSH